MIIRVLLLTLLFALSSGTNASSWADIRYAQDAAALDVHAPAEAGPHRVVVWLHGGAWDGGDKTLLDQQIARFNARGYVLVSVDWPLAPARHPAQIEHVAAALAWVDRNIARFGGDPSRIHLIGEGSGAHLAALLAADPRWLGKHALSPSIIAGVVLIDADSLDLVSRMQVVGNPDDQAWRQVWGDGSDGWLAASPLAQLRAGAATPRMLIIDRRDAPLARAQQQERFGDRLRSLGIPNQTFLLPRGSAMPDEVHLAGLGESGQEAAFAWLDSLSLPRVPRFENLGFETDFISGLDARSGLRGAETAFMQSFRGQLWASLSDVDSASSNPARLISKGSAESDWVNAQVFAPAQHFTALSAVHLARDGSGAPINTDVLLAGLASADGSAQWSWTLGEGRFQPVLDKPRHALVAVAMQHDPVTAADVILLGSAGGGIRAAVWSSRDAAPALSGASELEGANVVAIVIANGRAYAAVNGSNAGLYVRVDGHAAQWQRVTGTDIDGVDAGDVAALAAVPDPLGSGHEVLLAAHAQSGRIIRIDPLAGFARRLEVDIGAAFAEVWKGDRRAVQFGGNAFTALLHPQTADRVYAIGLRLSHPLATDAPHNGAWYLLRQQDGSYSYGMAYDYANPLPAGGSLGAVRAMVPSPFVNDRSGAVYFGGFFARSTDRDSAWIQRGSMDDTAPRRGIWWDRSHSGHGLDLQPIGNHWMLTFSTYDDAGQPVWYAATGNIVQSRFVADGGLSRFRYALDRDPPQRRDAQHSGEVSIRFGLDRGTGACNDPHVDRSDALALAELSLSIEGREVSWCIEPMRFSEAGVPTIDANGLWYAGPADAGWGISLTERGVDGGSLGVMHLYYYNADGEPRWALGTAPVIDGAARYNLRSFSGYCAGCERKAITSVEVGNFTQHLAGACGEVGGYASVDVQAPEDGDSRFVRSRIPMNRVSSAACY